VKSGSVVVGLVGSDEIAAIDEDFKKHVDGAEAADAHNKALVSLVSAAVAPSFSCAFVFDHKASGEQHIQLRHTETGVTVDLFQSTVDEAAVAHRTQVVKGCLSSDLLVADMHSLLDDALSLSLSKTSNGAGVSEATVYFSEQSHYVSKPKKMTGHALLLICQLLLRHNSSAAGGAAGGATPPSVIVENVEHDGRALFKALEELADEDQFLSRLEKSGESGADFALKELPPLTGNLVVPASRITELCKVAAFVVAALKTGKPLEFCLLELQGKQQQTMAAATTATPSFGFLPSSGPLYSPTTPPLSPHGGASPSSYAPSSLSSFGSVGVTAPAAFPAAQTSTFGAPLTFPSPLTPNPFSFAAPAAPALSSSSTSGAKTPLTSSAAAPSAAFSFFGSAAPTAGTAALPVSSLSAGTAPQATPTSSAAATPVAPLSFPIFPVSSATTPTIHFAPAPAGTSPSTSQTVGSPTSVHYFVGGKSKGKKK
jgi:hypothetical protein